MTSDELQSIDIINFSGTWHSSETATRGVSRLVLCTGPDELQARVYGSGPEGEINWGDVVATGLYSGGESSAAGAGFFLHYRLGSVESHIQANLKLGVAVLGVYTRFLDDSQRRPYFYREFLARAGQRPPRSLGAVVKTEAGEILSLKDLDFGTLKEQGPVDPSLLLGRWLNTSASPRSLAEITIQPAADRRHILIRGAHPEGRLDWAEAPAELYACVEEDDVASAAGLAHYDFGFLESELQVRQNKGILAVTIFHRFRDASGRFDHVFRELFYRAD
jgi:hypothetical protein